MRETEGNMRPIIRVIIAALPFAAVSCAPPPPPPPPPQPHMEATFAYLETTLHELEIADQYRDHGGHAGRATELVREGIRYRNEHGP
jgi:hypothetical protein